ncbi:MAG: methylmalonyl-CoA epimerase [FCB group bacterium]|nr:methylmalonyl-CoA epimerase [FCB group bacterium]
MNRRIAHVGVAVVNMDEAVRAFSILLDKEPDSFEDVADQKVKTAIYQTGESSLEFLIGTAPDSPITKYLEKRGTGIHHVCLRVDDLSAELMRLKEAGIRLIDEKPRAGAEGMLVAFVHPKSTAGILIELQQFKL